MIDAVVTMDRSKPFSTVHGERGPGDPHRDVHFFQDGLPFSAQGHMLAELVGAICTEQQQALAARKLKQVEAQMRARATAGDGGGNTKDEAGTELAPANPNDVNLDAWLRGTARYQWFSVSAAIKARYHKNVGNAANAVIFLVEEVKLVPAGEIAPGFRSAFGGD